MQVITHFKIGFCSALLALMFTVWRAEPAHTQEVSSAGEAKVEYRFSGPYTEDNLSIYLIHGSDAIDPRMLLTLDEALLQKKIVVSETGTVQELAVENISNDQWVFVQAGDIVKGGQQDRVISQHMLLKPKSGKTPISSFCVEQGRWQKRGNEEVTAFSSSKKKLNSKALKIAALAEKEQSKVWAEVAKVQEKLTKNTGAVAEDKASPSSLQLTLEQPSVMQSTSSYRSKFETLAQNNTDAVGYLFAINGELNSAEIYGAHEIFKRAWPKLLEATASEAVAEKDKTFIEKVFSETELKGFISAAESAPVKENIAVGAGKTVVREDRRVLFTETRSDANKPSVHKQYLAK